MNLYNYLVTTIYRCLYLPYDCYRIKNFFIHPDLAVHKFAFLGLILYFVFYCYYYYFFFWSNSLLVFYYFILFSCLLFVFIGLFAFVFCLVRNDNRGLVPTESRSRRKGLAWGTPVIRWNPRTVVQRHRCPPLR